MGKATVRQGMGGRQAASVIDEAARCISTTGGGRWAVCDPPGQRHGMHGSENLCACSRKTWPDKAETRMCPRGDFYCHMYAWKLALAF